MPSIYVKPYQSPCGTLLLGAYGDRLCLCDWQSAPHHARVIGRFTRFLHAEVVYGTAPVIEQAIIQLDAYFAGIRQTFGVPLFLVGTEFQKTVWNELLHIPYGTTLSYADLALRIGKPSAVRAVANATGANALSIFVPCHRVIGADGSLTGYAGGQTAKHYLLTRECNRGITLPAQLQIKH